MKKNSSTSEHLQDGPVTSYKYDYKSTYRGYNQKYPKVTTGLITPVTHLFSAILLGL